MERVSGRHRRTFSLPWIIVSSAVAVVVISAGWWFSYDQLAAKDCSGQIKLDIAAATEIADAVRTTAQQWVDGEDAQVNGVCVAVSVTPTDPAASAATIAQKHGVSLAGIGSAPGSSTVPDVWIPDSSMWLMRVSSEAPGFVPTGGQSIATSPVVLAAPAPIAQRLGWPDKKLRVEGPARPADRGPVSAPGHRRPDARRRRAVRVARAGRRGR